MPSVYIGVYTVLYPYEAQSDQELTVSTGDILYLLEKSTEDDWWKVKKKIPGLVTEEPVGLVPNNYIEPAPVKGQSKALFDYDKQTDEELSFKENTIFDVYDDSDQDWILVGHGDEFGFVPSNYIEPIAVGAASSAAPGPTPSSSSYPTSYDKPLPSHPSKSDSRQYGGEEEEEEPPSLPSRPRPASNSSSNNNNNSSSNGSAKRSQFFSWALQEVDGRKKHRATLAIGNGSIMYSVEKSNAPSQSWDVSDLINYNWEKKHVFLDFTNPPASLELHAGSKENADEIVAVLGELAGATRSAGLTEVIVAAHSHGQKMGKVLYDFDAQGKDEVTVREGDNVFIIDDKKSTEWWMVRTGSDKVGLMPSSYVEVAAGVSDSQPTHRSGSVQRHSSARIRAKSESKSSKHRRDDSRSKPDLSKVRTWTDRTGAFKVDAVLLGCQDGKIHLHKLNGVKIAVAASKMSVEDLDYVERVTGSPLNEDDRPLVDIRKSLSRKKSVSVPGGVSTGSNGGNAARKTNISNGQPKAQTQSLVQQSQQTQTQTQTQTQQSDYDWFGFFLECGVDVNNCQRYALNFTRDQMDESVLEDISPDILRNLGLKEGDILRVTRRLDEKFHRKRATPENASGGLFTTEGGGLRNNTSKGNGIGSSINDSTNSLVSTGPDSIPAKTASTNGGFDDDAWTVKSPVKDVPPPQPARPNQQRSNVFSASSSTSSLAKQPTPQPVQQKPQLQRQTTGYVPIAPLEPQKTSSALQTQQQQLQRLQASQVNPTIPPNATTVLIPAFTGSGQPVLIPQYTAGGSLIPQTTGGGTLIAQRTGGGTLISQRTGGAEPLYANNTGKSMLGPFATGNAQQLTGGGMGYMNTGFYNPFQPQPQIQQPQPNAFGSMMTPQQQTGSYSTPDLTGLTNQFQQTSIGGVQNISGQFGFNPGNQQPLQGIQTGGGYNVQNPFYGNNLQQQAQPMQTNSFGMPVTPLQGQPTGFGFGNTPPQVQQSQQIQQPVFNAFQGVPAAQTLGVLQPQRTGPHPPISFGGQAQQQPLQPTATGRRANLAAATPNNPFGF